jgi:hypothetical protein
MRQQLRNSSSHFEAQTHLRILAADFARALLDLSALIAKRAQGRPGAGSHPRSAARSCSARRPHSSIQVKPNTRPSLRSGLTAYAVLSREPNSFWPPSLRELTMWLTRLGAPHLREKLGRSDDGQDHTVLPYARSPAATGFDGIVHAAIEMLARRTKQRRSSARGLGLTGTTRPARTFSCRRCRVHRNPARNQ